MSHSKRTPRQNTHRMVIKLCAAAFAFLLTAGMAVIGWQLFPQLLKKDW